MAGPGQSKRWWWSWQAPGGCGGEGAGVDEGREQPTDVGLGIEIGRGVCGRPKRFADTHTEQETVPGAIETHWNHMERGTRQQRALGLPLDVELSFNLVALRQPDAHGWHR